MTDSMRIDRWLWAARFFKTRSLARQAIDGGKVHIDGHKTKPGKMIQPGMTLNVRQGYDVRTIEILALADRRGPACEAQALYRETPDSVLKREHHALERKALRASQPVPDHKPNKKERRDLRRFREQS